MTRKAYMSGALTGFQDIAPIKRFYEALAEMCEGMGWLLYLPHRVSDPLLNPDMTPRQVYELDRAHVIGSELIVAYVGVPSLGVGSEVEIARQCNLPVVLLYEEGQAVSRMVRGNPAVVGEIRFSDYDDAVQKLALWLGQWQGTANAQGAAG